MKSTHFTSFVILCILLLLSFLVRAASGLTMTITGVSDDKGDVLIAIFSADAGFPDNPKKAVRLLKGKPASGKAVVVVNDLPNGKYAVSVFHDTNFNEKFDTNFLGIPEEGYGVSNNALNTFSAPKYSEAAFNHQGNTQLEIKLKY